MARSRQFRAVLDANVIYPAFLRDVLLRLAASDLYLPHWTPRIHDEWIRNVTANRPDLSPARLARTCTMMDSHFPGALVTDYEGLEVHFPRVAPEDRHVAAAAFKAGANRIVTLNLKDFPSAALHPHGIKAVHPDEFVSELVRDDHATISTVLETHRIELRRPPLTPDAYRAAFIRGGLPKSAALIWP